MIGDSLFNKFSVNKDTTRVIYLLANTGRYFMIYNNVGTRLMEGETGRHRGTDYMIKDGLWKTYYINGNIKSEGYYYRNNPVGLWKKYFLSGRLKSIYNVAFVAIDTLENYCMSGSYIEYFENGKIAIDGHYCVELGMDTVRFTRAEPPYEEYDDLVKRPVSKKCFVWKYFDESGILLKEIDYDLEAAH